MLKKRGRESHLSRSLGRWAGQEQVHLLAVDYWKHGTQSLHPGEGMVNLPHFPLHFTQLYAVLWNGEGNISHENLKSVLAMNSAGAGEE